MGDQIKGNIPTLGPDLHQMWWQVFFTGLGGGEEQHEPELLHVFEWLKPFFNQEDAAEKGMCLPIPQAAGLSLQ